MRLTAHIKEATDGRITLRVEELPDLIIHVRTILEIPDAIRDAAAQLTDRDKKDFEVELDF
jgi:hypothetical protein